MLVLALGIRGQLTVIESDRYGQDRAGVRKISPKGTDFDLVHNWLELQVGVIPSKRMIRDTLSAGTVTGRPTRTNWDGRM